MVGALVLGGCFHVKEAPPELTPSETVEEPVEEVAPTPPAEEEAVEPVEETTKEGDVPSLVVENQAIVNNTITIGKVTTAALQPSWVVIHADVQGKPGEVVGYSAVSVGEQMNVLVTLDEKVGGGTLHAMLHDDKGTIGAYEFPGPDVPTLVENQMVITTFMVTKGGTAPVTGGSAPSNTTTNTGGGTTGTTTPESSPQLRKFTITARKWEFDPSTITVKKGDTVQFTVMSVDVTHGFSIPDFNVNKTLEPGKSINFEFIANKIGTFSFACSVYCGEGHKDMKGTLIVEE